MTDLRQLNPSHKLNGLVPQKRSDLSNYSLRNDSNIERFCKRFIPSSVSVFNNLSCLLIFIDLSFTFFPCDLALQPFDILKFALVFLFHLLP